MQIENLNEDDVSSLEEKLKELNLLRSESNDLITHRVFPMETLELSRKITELVMLMGRVLERLENIFGGNVLINGKFVDLRKPPKP